MQREITNVARACHLPNFRYVQFAPVTLAVSSAEADDTREADLDKATPNNTDSDITSWDNASSDNVNSDNIGGDAGEPVIAPVARPAVVPLTVVETRPPRPEPAKRTAEFVLLSEVAGAIASARTPLPGPRADVDAPPAADARPASKPPRSASSRLGLQRADKAERPPTRARTRGTK